MKLTGISYGEQFEEALKATTPEEAAQRFELLVAYQMGALMCVDIDKENVREKAIHNVRVNLGYMAAYYSQEVCEKIKRLYGVVHPILGV